MSPEASSSISLHCAGKTQEWLQQYPWTGYCLPYFGGTMSEALCGQCLRLTNTRTLAQEIVRIVDGCGSAGAARNWTAWLAMGAVFTGREGLVHQSAAEIEITARKSVKPPPPSTARWVQA